ncbi:MAG: polysaccharide biosynthesis/export family protein [Cyclobacteriaceae bacterium]|nr:polysaccharide biosynthesis/export family protein [Cyclobacteriaceae bacterium]
MRFLILVFSIILVSCGSYRQNIMFNSQDEPVLEKLKRETAVAEANYKIRKNDQLKLILYSNEGEKLIDPNPELTATHTVNPGTASTGPVYPVDINGIVRFPMIGEINLESLTLRQAEEILQKEYARFFKSPYVQVSCVNKRVVLLGAVGGQVIPLENDNIKLLEVLALAKGLPNDAKAGNIKLIRGEQVYEVDLSTIQGFKEGNFVVEPGDVIYVEPVRRPFSEGLRDNSVVLSLLVSLTTLIVVLNNTF